jgi:hypothetical protein
MKFKDGPDYLIKSYYDENDKLIDFNISLLSEAGRIPLTYEQKGKKVKMMVWQSLDNIKPITDVSEYSIN